MLKPRKKITKKQIKEDPLVTYYFKSVDFMRAHSQKIMIGVIAVFAIIILLVMFANSKKSAELGASEQLARANGELSQRRSQEAIDILLLLVDNYSGTKSAARGVYVLASTYFDMGEYEKSQLYFEKFIDDNDGDPILKSAAFTGLASSLEQQNKFLEAAKIYEKGAKKFENNFNAAQQLMHAARCYTNANQIAQARNCYQLVLDKHSESGQKNDAELFLARLKG